MSTNILGRSALIIDDDRDFRIIINKILQKLGVRSFEAEDSIQALSVLANTKVDIILLDMNLIYEKGLEFLKTVAGTSLAEIPVIIISSESEKRTVLSAIAYGAKDYIVKPVDLETVMRKLAKWLPPFGLSTTVLPLGWVNSCSVRINARITAINSFSVHFQSPVLFGALSRVALFGTLKKYVQGDSDDLFLTVNTTENDGNTFISIADFHPISDTVRSNIQSIKTLWKKYDDLETLAPKKRVNLKTVCILDDDQQVLKLLESVVINLGYRAVGFESPDALFSFLGENQVTACLIDIWIAGKPIGYEITHRIRKLLGHGVSCIAVSGDQSQEIAADTLEAGFDSWILKDGANSMREVIRTHLSHAAEKMKKSQSEPLYIPPEGFCDADICFDVRILEVDEVGVKLWSENLIRKGTEFIIKEAQLDNSTWLSSLLKQPLEFTVITNGICPIADQKGYLMFAEFSGDRSFFINFKSKLDELVKNQHQPT